MRLDIGGYAYLSLGFLLSNLETVSFEGVIFTLFFEPSLLVVLVLDLDLECLLGLKAEVYWVSDLLDFLKRALSETCKILFPIFPRHLS